MAIKPATTREQVAEAAIAAGRPEAAAAAGRMASTARVFSLGTYEGPITLASGTQSHHGRTPQDRRRGAAPSVDPEDGGLLHPDAEIVLAKVPRGDP
jgi:hypothetical protein